MTRRILVVDDEAAIRTVLTAYLEADGFEVAQAGTGHEASVALASSRPTELILLDVGLPDVNGLELLTTIRTNSDVPVILVTARSEEVDKLVGLNVGADDYITKPFSPREVVARVNTVLRRAGRGAAPAIAEDGVLRFPTIQIDPQRRELTVKGEPVLLSALDFDLLLALARAPGRVFSRSQLLEKVWGYEFYGDDRVVDVHVKTLRNSLGDEATAPSIIGTVRGVGYKFLPRQESPK